MDVRWIGEAPPIDQSHNQVIGLETDRNESLTLVYSLPNLEDGRCFFFNHFISFLLLMLCLNYTDDKRDRQEGKCSGEKSSKSVWFCLILKQKKKNKNRKNDKRVSGAIGTQSSEIIWICCLCKQNQRNERRRNKISASDEDMLTRNE